MAETPPQLGDSLRKNTGEATHEIVNRLAGLGDGNRVRKAIETTSLAIVTAKEILKGFDFAKSAPAEIAKITNAWRTWEDDGIFKDNKYNVLRQDLQKMLKKSGLHDVNYFVRQIWRTDITEYVMEKIKDRSDKADIMVLILEEQPARDDSPKDVMKNIVLKDILGADVDKKELAKQMSKGWSGSWDQIPAKFGVNPKMTPISVKVVTGGALLNIPLPLATKFTFKNAVKQDDDDTIYAQMQNGCEGNFVVIELGAPPPPPKVPEEEKPIDKKPQHPKKPPEKIRGNKGDAIEDYLDIMKGELGAEDVDPEEQASEAEAKKRGVLYMSLKEAKEKGFVIDDPKKNGDVLPADGYDWLYVSEEFPNFATKPIPKNVKIAATPATMKP